MIPDQNWPRWFYTSIVKHFSLRNGDIPFYIEGQSRPTTKNDFAELRIDGPYFNEVSHAVWDINILVAILIQIVQNDTDLFKIQRFTGVFFEAFTTDLPVFRFGDGERDDAKQFLCLSLSPDRNERIRVTQYGQIQSGTNVAQASIEARYQGKLYTPY
jgi:hypothetical protein